jgi:hypothetical protein
VRVRHGTGFRIERRDTCDWCAAVGSHIERQLTVIAEERFSLDPPSSVVVSLN